MFAVTIFAIAQIVSERKRVSLARDPKISQCSRCGSDVVTTRGPGRTALFDGVTVAVPPEMPLVRCHGCGTAYPDQEQATELRAIAERDWLGDGGRGFRPVVSGT
jgi:RNase P subunit RPR2